MLQPKLNYSFHEVDFFAILTKNTEAALHRVFYFLIRLRSQPFFEIKKSAVEFLIIEAKITNNVKALSISLL